MPIDELIKHRHMSTEETFNLCRARDTWRHTLLTCPMSSSVWALAPEQLVQQLVDRQEESSKDWLFALHEILSKDKFVRLVGTS